jgi:hypothetical protein
MTHNKCNGDEICTYLNKQLVEFGQPGFSKLEQVVNDGSGPKIKLHSIGYKKTKKDRFFALVVCPWCEGKPGFYQDTP